MSKMVSVNSIRSHASGMNAIALTTGFLPRGIPKDYSTRAASGAEVAHYPL
jgi:hypothetical protein